MNVLWSPQAIEDLISVRAFLEAESPAAAPRVVGRILDAVENLLADNPQMGRPGRVSGTRELIVSQTPYIVPYRVREETIQILRVYHSARRWPENL
jgi:toxin ParE1/3/4